MTTKQKKITLSLTEDQYNRLVVAYKEITGNEPSKEDLVQLLKREAAAITYASESNKQGFNQTEWSF